MSDVVLTLGGRAYSVACAPGEEAHIADLGQIIEAKLRTLPGGMGKNDSRSLLFAALLLADELFELRNAQKIVAPAGTDLSAVTPDRLDALATRLEALADALELPGPVPSH
ncbi:MAG: cell division protein ZapA [Pseudomonadota bacterium]|nr:cell division protein ZapA [Pseudomonadota bacterium]